MSCIYPKPETGIHAYRYPGTCYVRYPKTEYVVRKEPQITMYPDALWLNMHRLCCERPISNPYSCPAVPGTGEGEWSPMEPFGKVNMTTLLGDWE